MGFQNVYDYYDGADDNFLRTKKENMEGNAPKPSTRDDFEED